MSILLHKKIFYQVVCKKNLRIKHFISTSNLKIAIIEYNFKSPYKFSNENFF